MGSIKDSRHIGAKIRNRRKAVGMTQEGLGELVGVSYQQVQKYEKGLSRLSPERLQQVAAALDIPVWYFFREEENRKTEKVSAGTVCRASRSRAVTGEEQELLRRFRRVSSPAHRTLVMSLLKALAQHIARSD